MWCQKRKQTLVSYLLAKIRYHQSRHLLNAQADRMRMICELPLLGSEDQGWRLRTASSLRDDQSEGWGKRQTRCASEAEHSCKEEEVKKALMGEAMIETSPVVTDV